MARLMLHFQRARVNAIGDYVELRVRFVSTYTPLTLFRRLFAYSFAHPFDRILAREKMGCLSLKRLQRGAERSYTKFRKWNRDSRS